MHSFFDRARRASPCFLLRHGPPGLVALGLVLVVSGVAQAAEETSVSPGINDIYRDAALDVEFWEQVFTGESREVFRARHRVVDAVKPYPGDRIADIGAGTGLYTKLFAEAVGSAGQVYAVDIAPEFLEFIAGKAADAGLMNVTTVLGADHTTNLPEGGVDVVFHADSYHHFEYPKSLTRDMARALVRGGELYVLDFERIPGVTEPETMRHVRADKAAVIAEIEASGFALVEEIALPELEANYLLRFRKR